MRVSRWDALELSGDRPGVWHRRVFGENVQVQHLITEPGGEPAKAHSHPRSEQFYLVEQGRWEVTVEGESREIRPGDIVYIPADAQHTVRLLGPEKGQILEIYSPPINPPR